MNNQKELEKELEGLSYLPKTTEPKKDVLVNVDEKVDVDDTTKLSLKQRIAKVLEDFKKKGKKLSPKLKKWATSALAGSLVAAMLFLGSCANMKSMEQIYPRSVVQMLEDNGYTSQDYDTKKQEFLNANPADLDCGLQIVPHNYYKEKFGLTDQEISDRVLGRGVYFVNGSLYLGAQYVPTFEKLGMIKEGEDWNLNREVLSRIKGHPIIIGTLFRYDLEPEVYEAIKSAYTKTDKVINSKRIDEDKYSYPTYDNNTILNGKKMAREDFENNFQYRYLLNSILTSYTPNVLGEEACYSISPFWSRNSKEDIVVMATYMISGFPYIENGYLYVYFIGKDRNDPYQEMYLYRASIELTAEDWEKINQKQSYLGVKGFLTKIVGNAKESKRTVYYYQIGKCENNLRQVGAESSKALVVQDFIEHGGRPECLEDEYLFTLN